MVWKGVLFKASTTSAETCISRYAVVELWPDVLDFSVSMASRFEDDAH